ncbi:hypothetical protein [Sulfitobacter sp. BSw21498]|uniref:hypothetical protein n=1 Tax=Sulfitobacter sp. BSw21498 TaxID=664426 RepID=UPI0020C78BE5|nr:hypothetical protein [Sulfitobacter sp. BSw21498]
MKVTHTLPILATAALMAATAASADSFSLSGARSAMQSDISFNAMQSAGQGQIKLRHKVQPKAQARTPTISSRSRSFQAFSGVSTAADLKSLIAWAEAGPKGYDAVQYGAKRLPPQRPTQMTIGEIYRWIDRTPGQQHAIGRYQFIPATLRSLVRQAGLSKNDRFTPKLQDGLADILLADAGFVSFKKGEISRHRFMENLARIWAGFPTASGRSYYHGYAGNKAVISWNEFDAVMRKIFATKRS